MQGNGLPEVPAFSLFGNIHLQCIEALGLSRQIVFERIAVNLRGLNSPAPRYRRHALGITRVIDDRHAPLVHFIKMGAGKDLAATAFIVPILIGLPSCRGQRQ